MGGTLPWDVSWQPPGTGAFTPSMRCRRQQRDKGRLLENSKTRRATPPSRSSAEAPVALTAPSAATRCHPPSQPDHRHAAARWVFREENLLKVALRGGRVWSDPT